MSALPSHVYMMVHVPTLMEASIVPVQQGGLENFAI